MLYFGDSIAETIDKERHNRHISKQEMARIYGMDYDRMCALLRNDRVMAADEVLTFIYSMSMITFLMYPPSMLPYFKELQDEINKASTWK